MEEIHSWTAKMLWGQCWENTEGEGFHLPFTPKEGSPEEGPFSRHHKLNKDSACTWKWGVVCCAERALCREPCAGAMNSFMVPQSMDACWNFYNYRALKEHCKVTGTFQRKQRDQLRSNPCSGVHGWDRRRATCCAESKVQFHKSACVAKDTQIFWVANFACREERKLYTETRTHEC